MSEAPEIAAVRARYDRRKAAGLGGGAGMLDPSTWQMVQERERAIIRVLYRRPHLRDPGALRLVDVGCGTGGSLLGFLRLGFRPENLQGIELIEERAAAARAVLPEALVLHRGDATEVEIPPESQDVVFQAVVFSSLLDRDFQARLAEQMWSWVRTGGGILWYDFTWDNPRNLDVRGVPLRRIRELFPQGELTSHRVTLAPPIARRVAAIHPGLYRLFGAIPFLRTHVLCWIAKP